jgi:hypothetical protein
MYSAVQYLHKDLIQKPYLLCSSRSRYHYTQNENILDPQTAFTYAVQFDDLEMVKYVLNSNILNINRGNSKAIKASIKNENIPIFEFLTVYEIYDIYIEYAISFDSVKMFIYLTEKREGIWEYGNHLFEIFACGSTKIFCYLQEFDIISEIIEEDFRDLVETAVIKDQTQFTIKVCQIYRDSLYPSNLSRLIRKSILRDNVRLFVYFIRKHPHLMEMDFIDSICKTRAFRIAFFLVKRYSSENHKKMLYRSAFLYSFIELAEMLWEHDHFRNDDIVVESLSGDFTEAIKFWGEKDCLKSVKNDVIRIFLINCCKSRFNRDENFSLLLKYYPSKSSGRVSKGLILHVIENNRIGIVAKMAAYKVLPYLEIKNLISDKYDDNKLESFERCHADALSEIDSDPLVV